MKRILSLFLSLTILLFSLLPLSACNQSEIPPNKPPSIDENDKNGDEEKEEAEIKVPEYKDYQRGTVDFENMKYTRPDIDAAVLKISDVAELIDKNELAYEEQLAKLDYVANSYKEILSMTSLAEINSRHDSSNSYWSEETYYIHTNYPKFSQAIEKLFIAAASSPSCDSFAADFFGDELYDYKDGGIYTDKLVELMAKEAEYENEYNSISTKSIIIKYNGVEDSYENILNFYRETYGEDSKDYLSASSVCKVLYEEAVSLKSAELLVSLIRQRRLISDELGYESYRDFAYETIYHDYDPEDMKKFTDDVKNYVIPVYLELSRYVFTPNIEKYENLAKDEFVSNSELINTLYDAYGDAGQSIYEIYSYMLQHKLYDIEAPNANRFSGAFSLYIANYNAPFLFATVGNSVLDYTTISHEFGHFADAYINYNGSTSLDLSELYSQAMELLTVEMLDGKLNNDAYRYLKYTKLEELLGTIIFQTFYASFEAKAYELPLESITKEKLDAVVAQTAREMGISDSWNNIEYIMIPHIILYPFYVQSYATSGVAAAEIYCLEAENEGAGFEVYYTLLKRNNELSFEENLKAAGLSSPFEEKALMELTDRIHYIIIGSHYFEEDEKNAA